MHRLAEEVRRSEEMRSTFALMIMDADHFKDINDNHGHLYGDRVLAAMGHVIENSTRGIDIVCRYGGDEFVILLPESGEQDAVTVARRIRERLKEFDWPAEVDRRVLAVTTSIGYAVYPIHATTGETLLAAADRALYAAKDTGRDRAHVAATPPDGIEERPFLTSPQMVGRLEAWSLLESAVDSAVRGTGRTVIITGEMGIGKTRLLRELKKSSRFNQLTPVRFLTAYCHQESRSLALHPFRELLADVFLRFSDPEEDLFEGVEEGEREEVLDFVSAASPGGRPLPDRSVQLQASVRFTAAVQTLLTNVSRRVPVALLVEDVHWADHHTLDLVHYLSRATVRERMMIALTIRPDALPENSPASETLQRLRVEDLALLVSLERLSPAEVGAMLDLMFPTKRVSQQLKEVVFAETEGNPYYVEELLRALLSESKLAGVEDGRELTLVPDAPLPRTVRDSITARLNALEPSTRELLAVASIFGQKFELRLLAALAGGSLSSVAEGLRPAEEKHLVKASASDGRESSVFLHSKIQEALYDTLSESRARDLHAKAGEIIERRIGTPEERSTDWDDMVSHFRLGGLSAKVAFYAPQLGQRAADLFQFEDAERYFRWAAEGARDTGRASIEGAALRNLAEIAHATGRLENARVYCRNILDSTHLKLPDGERAGVLALLASVEDRLGLTDLALASVQQARSILDSVALPNDFRLARVRNVEGSIRARRGELDRARVLHESVITMIAGLDQPDRNWRREQAEALHSLGTVAELVGDAPETLDRHKAAARILESIGDLPGHARVTISLGYVYLDDGVVEEAVACFTSALKIREQLNDVLGIAEAVCALGSANVVLGRYSKAREHLHRALTIRANLGDLAGQAVNLAELSALLLRQGDVEAADRHATESLSIAQKLRDPGLSATARLSLAQALLARDRAETARELCDAAVGDLQESGLASRLMTALTLRAKALVTLGDHGAAEDDIRAAVEASHSCRRRSDHGRRESVAADLAAARGDFALADEHYRKSMDMLRAVGDPYDVGAVHLSLARLYRRRGLQEAARESAERARLLFGRVGARSAYAECEALLSSLD